MLFINESVWFAALTSIALKSTVALAMAWLLTLVLRRRSAAARRLVWTASVAAILALPFLSISLPVLPVRAPAALNPEANVIFQATSTAATAGSPSVGRPTALRTPAPWTPDWRLYLMVLWAAGSAWTLARTVAACIAMARLRRKSKASPYRDLTANLARELGIPHAIETLEGVADAMPVTFGILRPAILLPSGAAAWSAERRRAVILHELAHVRGGDVATQRIARLALILHWWNPLAWIAWRELLKESERAADDLVLSLGERASDYAGHLLDVARALQAPPDRGWAVAMARRSQLEGRLAAILDSRVNRQTASRAGALVAALAGIAMIAPLAAVRAQEAPAIPADVDATIRAALAQKNHDMLDKAALGFEGRREYDVAHKLLDTSLEIVAETSGRESSAYGLALLKIADVEKRRNRLDEATSFYSKAVQLLDDRAETAPALLYLGRHEKQPEASLAFFDRAQSADPAHAGTAKLWKAVTLERQGETAEAEESYKAALAGDGPETAGAADTMRLYARFLKNQGRDAEAKVMDEHASAIQRSLPPGHRASAGDNEAEAAEAAEAKAKAERANTAAAGTSVYRVGNGVTPPSVLSKVDPQYSEEARFAKYSGTVLLQLQIRPDGTADNISITRGLGLGLDEKAVEAVQAWRFKPGTKDGSPVTVAATIEVNFRLL